MPDDRRLGRLLQLFLADITQIGEQALQSGDYERWAADFDTLLMEYHLGAYFLGKGVDDLTPEAQRVVATLIEQQLQYRARFGDERSELSDRAFLARSSLYGGALKATYSHAKWADWPLPFHPTEGSECMVNCQCHWDGQQLDHAKGDGRFTWVIGTSETCPTCTARHEASPYVVKGYTLVTPIDPALHPTAASEEPEDHRAATHARD